MKRNLIIAALLLGSSVAYSQTRFGVKAGVNLASMTIKGDALTISMSPGTRASFHVTMLADIPLSSLFYFQPSLTIGQKGFKIDESFDQVHEDAFFSEKAEVTTDPLYLEIPVNFLAKFDAGRGKFMVGAGPYVAYGLSGNLKYKLEETSSWAAGQSSQAYEEGDVPLFDKNNSIKRGDFGLNFLTGYELNSGLFLQGGYSLGLQNITKAEEGSLKNKVWSLSLGHLF